jgi:formylmethanofuran dehydrogenase subunit D
MEIGKFSKEYFDAVSICETDKSTLETLGIKEGDSIIVETEIGKVVVTSKIDRRAESGVVFIPCGPYANAVTSSDTLESGMPAYKAVPARIYAAKGESVLSVEELLKKIIEGS